MAGKLGPYQVRSELGRGAMAVVWRARDSVLERDVAIKEPLLPKGVDAVAAAEFGARFVREAKAVARLNHPNIVTIHAADIFNGRAAIVMELVDGETLGQILRRGALAPRAALDVLEQLLSAVGYAHERGIVHRDIKPDNIFLTPEGRVKLTDFGIASLASDSTLTQAGAIMGTPGYMAPEQITGGAVDARADIFAVGVLAYEMLTGRNPFGATEKGTPTTTLMYRIVHQPPPELPAEALSGLPGDVRAVLEVALAKDPAGRFPDARSFLAALEGEGPLPVPAAQGIAQGGVQAGTVLTKLVGTKAATVLARADALKGKTALPWAAGSSRKPSWLRSWIPYAALVGIGLIVMVVLLATSSTPPRTATDLSALATLSASAEYLPGGSNPGYFVENLVDGNPATCWSVHDGGPGEWVEFTFRSTVTLTELRLIAGYDKRGGDFDRWPTNNRLRGYRIQFSDGTSVAGEVLDQRGSQIVSFAPTKTTYLRLTVLSVYPYQRIQNKFGWNDTSISEMHPWGY